MGKRNLFQLGTLCIMKHWDVGSLRIFSKEIIELNREILCGLSMVTRDY